MLKKSYIDWLLDCCKFWNFCQLRPFWWKRFDQSTLWSSLYRWPMICVWICPCMRQCKCFWWMKGRNCIGRPVIPVFDGKLVYMRRCKWPDTPCGLFPSTLPQIKAPSLPALQANSHFSQCYLQAQFQHPLHFSNQFNHQHLSFHYNCPNCPFYWIFYNWL